MASKKGDEWWRLENKLIDHRNAAVWLGVAILIAAIALFSRCELLTTALGWNSSPYCPTVQIGADMGVAVGTISLAYSAFVTAAQAERESSRAREAHVRLWACDSSDRSSFEPRGVQSQQIITGQDGLDSLFIDNIGPGTAELVTSDTRWRLRGEPKPGYTHAAPETFHQPYLGREENTPVCVSRELRKAIQHETDETCVEDVLVEVRSHGFGGAPASEPWLYLHRVAPILSSAPLNRTNSEGDRPSRRWEWTVISGMYPNQPPEPGVTDS
jgi:hypothetical protein